MIKNIAEISYGLIKIGLFILLFSNLFLLNVDKAEAGWWSNNVCCASGSAIGSGDGRAGQGSQGSSGTGGSRGSQTTARSGIAATTNSGTLALQIARDMNNGSAGSGSVIVPHGYTAVVVSGSMAGSGHTYGVSVVKITSNSNNNNQTPRTTNPPPPPLPSLTFSSNKSTYIIGETMKLTWVPTNVTSCTASGSWLGPKAYTSGSKSENIGMNTIGSFTYTLSCSRADVAVTKSVTVTVVPVTDLTPVNVERIKACSQTSCGNATLKFKIKNIGASIPNGRNVPYQIQYRVKGEVPWTTGSTGNWTTGIAMGATTAFITQNITGLTYSNYEARVLINTSNFKNTQLGETNFTDNISSPVPLSIAPNPTVINFKAVNDVVRFNTSTKLEWTVTAAFQPTCKLIGAGLNSTFKYNQLTNSGSTTSPPLKNKQTFVYSCNSQSENGFVIPATEQSITVEVVPRVQEV